MDFGQNPQITLLVEQAEVCVFLRFGEFTQQNRGFHGVRFLKNFQGPAGLARFDQGGNEACIRLSEVMQGKRKVNMDLAKRLYKVLNISPEFILETA